VETNPHGRGPAITITLTTQLSRPAIAEGETATLYLVVQLTAPSEANTARLPLNLSAVVDRSGSMAGEKLAYTKKALRFLIDQTIASDYLSCILFDDEVQTLFPADHVTNKDALKAQTHHIHEGGSTNLSGGMIAGYKQVKAHLVKGAVNRVLLMTDGQANTGVIDPAALVAKVTSLNEAGMQLSALGVGADFNEDLLSAMAQAGGGNFHFIANPDQIPAVFGQELNGLLSTVAQGLEVHFTAAPGVAAGGVIGYRPAGTPGDLRVTLPDIYAGETKSLVLQLHLQPAFAGNRPLGRIELTFNDVTLTQDLLVTVTGDSALLAAPESPEVLKQLYLARSGEALDQAIEKADEADFATSSSTLREAAAPMLAMAQATGDADLLERAGELTAQADALEARSYDAVSRKQMRAQSFQSRTGRRK